MLRSLIVPILVLILGTATGTAQFTDLDHGSPPGVSLVVDDNPVTPAIVTYDVALPCRHLTAPDPIVVYRARCVPLEGRGEHVAIDLRDKRQTSVIPHLRTFRIGRSSH